MSETAVAGSFRKAGDMAAGIIYAIGQNNFIFDKSQPIHMTAVDIVEPLGVAKTTAANKVAEIRKMLKINYYNSEWVLPSELEKNPMLWFVELNGFLVDARSLPLDLQIYCAEKGLIPYVPGLKE